jgi:hypothetical protein
MLVFGASVAEFTLSPSKNKSILEAGISQYLGFWLHRSYCASMSLAGICQYCFQGIRCNDWFYADGISVLKHAYTFCLEIIC